MATPAHPPLTPVAASSNIAAAGYDAANQQFAVQFKSGHIYTYSEVSPEVAERFQAADSKGRFFGEHVRQKFAGNKSCLVMSTTNMASVMCPPLLP